MLNGAVVGAAYSRRLEDLEKGRRRAPGPRLARELEELRDDVLKAKRAKAHAAITDAYVAADAEARRIVAEFERAKAEAVTR